MVVAAAGISAGGSLLGGLFGSSGAEQAAKTNAAAERQAIAASLQEQQNAFGAGQYAFGQLQQIAPQFGAQANAAVQPYFNYGEQALGDSYQNAYDALNPYVSNGQNIGSLLTGELTRGALGQAPDLFNLQNLPGYQFTLDQGLKATQNAAAAQGLGVSGAALKGAINYAENTANTFANNYLQNYWANQNNRYNMLAGVQNTGATAAGQLGTLAQLTGSGRANLAGNVGTGLMQGYFGQGNQLTASGGQLGAGAESAASAAGGQQATAATAGGLNVGTAQQNAANLLGSGFSGASSGIGNALLLNQLLNNNSGGSTIGPNSAIAQTVPGTTNQFASF